MVNFLSRAKKKRFYCQKPPFNFRLTNDRPVSDQFSSTVFPGPSTAKIKLYLLPALQSPGQSIRVVLIGGLSGGCPPNLKKPHPGLTQRGSRGISPKNGLRNRVQTVSRIADNGATVRPILSVCRVVILNFKVCNFAMLTPSWSVWFAPTTTPFRSSFSGDTPRNFVVRTTRCHFN